MTDPSPAVTDRASWRWRQEGWRLVELFALCGFVVVQPLLDVLGRNPDFFIFHGVSGWPVVGLVALSVLVPPLVVWLPGLASGVFGPRVRHRVHLASVGVLLVLLLVQVGKQLVAWRGWLLAGAAVVAASLVWWAFVRWPVVRQVVRVAAVGPLVFALLFAFVSPAAAVVGLGGAATAGTGAGRPVGPHPPAVVIVLDELPLLSLLDADGRIDAQRYPNFARLADESTWWRNATTVSGWTPYALPAILTGRYPAAHVAPHYTRYPDNLFTLVSDVYRVEAHESIAHLCPPWQCGDLAAQARGGFGEVLAGSWTLLRELLSPFDSRRDPQDAFVEPTVAEQLAEAVRADQIGPEFRFHEVGANQPVRFQRFLDRLDDWATTTADPVDPPTLHFLHLLLPHTPWRYLPSGMRYDAPPLPLDGPWWGRLAQQRMEAQLAYTDRLLGEVLRVLDESGRYDEVLLVVTSDHGYTFTPGDAGVRELAEGDRHDAMELAWVPLFIKAPGQAAGVVDDRNWQHVDLLPTLADLMGVELPWEVDGISWVRAERTGSAKTFVSTLDEIRELDGDDLFAEILADPTAVPALAPVPRPDLVGRSVAGLPQVAGPSGAVVENAEAFASVRLADGVVPALVWGSVPDEVVASGLPLAVVVNGRVGAVVPVVEEDGVGRFAALVVDDSLFRDGANRVELYLVAGDGDDTVLHRVD